MTTLLSWGLTLLTRPKSAVEMFPAQTGSDSPRPGLLGRFPAILAGVLLATSSSALAVPILTGINPASGSTAGGQSITLTGQDFGASPIVIIGGQVATVQPGGSSTSVVVTSPAGQGTNLQVILYASSISSNPLAFSYLPPSISGVLPTTGPSQGGITLTITGSNFGLSPSVNIGPNSAPITLRTHTQITCTLPAGQGQNLPVSVFVGGQSSNTASFTYTAPAITSISPSNGPVAGGTPITITGSNFGTSPVVMFDGVTVPAVADVVTPHAKLHITSPPGTGTGRKIAVIAGGQFSNSLSFNYDGPILTGSNPAIGPTTGGTPITLTGSNFGPTSTVTIGGANAPLLPGSVVGNVIVASPAGQGNGVELRITNSERQSAVAFFSYSPPSITSINPSSAPNSGNVPITITGQNFGVSPSVMFGGCPVPMVSYSHSEIVFTLPPSIAGGTNLPVVVIARNQSSNAILFSYILPQLTDTTDTDADGLNDATERQLGMYGFDWQLAQPAMVGSFLTGNTLYTLSQVQALNVGTPLLQRDGLGQFKLTIGVQKSATLQPGSFQPFALDSAGASTSINGAGKLEFLFTVPDNAAFFRVQAQ